MLGPKAAQYAVVLLVGIIMEYFAGREHLKYEMRSAFQSAATDIQNSFKGGPGAPKSESEKPKIPPAPKAEEPPSMDVTLVKKGFIPVDLERNRYQATITIQLNFKNLMDKDIRAFDGTVKFTDLLDNEILASHVAINEKVPANGALSWEGGINFNQFLDADTRFRNEDLQNLKATFVAHKILFADGSTKEPAAQ